MSENDALMLVVISSPDGFEHELKAVHQMFNAGLQHFHLRKPKFSTRRMQQYLNRVDRRFRNRIIIHSHHELCVKYKLRGIHLTKKHRRNKRWQTWFLKKYVKLFHSRAEITAGYHSLDALQSGDMENSYVFLSPVFDSISKVGYKSAFNEDSLKKTLAKTNLRVIALGGIDEDKILRASKLGFSGVAVLGSIWKSEHPVQKFKNIKQLCEQTGNM